MKLAFQEGLYPIKNYRGFMGELAGWGFDAVEVWGDGLKGRLGDVAAAAKAAKLPVSSICPGGTGIRGSLLDGDAEKRRAAAEDIKDYLEMGAELGGAGLVLVPEFGAAKFMSLYPDHGDFERKKADFAEQLSPLADRAKELGVLIFLEPLNRYEAFFMLTVSQGAEICRMLGNPAVKVMADLFHMGIEENNLTAAIEDCGKYIAHVHLVDTNRKLPGLGDRDFKPVIKSLNKVGFDGYLCMECGIKGNPRKEVPESVAFMKKLM